MRTLKYLLLLLFASLCFAQTTQSVSIPPCTLNGSFSANGVSHNFPNSTPSCDKWTLTVYNTTLSTFSLTLQSAPAATPSTPGAFVTYIGATVTGSNPVTATGVATFTNGTFATPWLRISAASITGTGTVYFVLQGSQTIISKGGGGGAPSGPAGGDLSGSYPSPIVVNLSNVSNSSLQNGGLANPAAIVNGVTCTLGSPCLVSGPNQTVNAVLKGQGSAIPLASGVTIDGSNNVATPGSITSGSGSGVAGIFDLAQGTAPSIPANSFGLVAPATITTSEYLQPPNAVPSAHSTLIVNAPTGNISPFSYKVVPDCQDTGGDHLNFTQSTDMFSCGNSGGGGGSSAGATLFSTTSSTTVTATSPTTLIGAGTGTTTIAANTFTAGQVLEFVAQGFYTTPVTPASLTITLNIGGTIRITTGAVVQIASVTNGVWRVRCMVTTRTAGSSGTQIANCIFEGTGASLTPGESPLQTSSTWTIDTTATQVLDLVATWSTATGAPTITSTNVAAWIPGAPVTSVNTQTGAVSLFTTNAQTSTYQVLASDFVGCKTIPVASGTFTITLVASGSQPPSGQCITILNYGTGVVTLARSGQNINGAAANLTGTAGSATAPTGWYVVSDGTNYVAEVIGGGGGGSSVSYKYTYYPAGVNGQQLSWSITSSFFGNNAVNAPGGIGGTINVGLSSWNTGGAASTMIISSIPSTWDGSAINLDVDALFNTSNTGNASLAAYSACLSTGTGFLSPSWSSAGSTVTVAAPGAGTLQVFRWALTVPVTGCSAGNLLYVLVNRPSDTYPNAIFLIGGNLGIKY